MLKNIENDVDTRKDRRAPRATNESVKKSMKGNKSKNTFPELLLRKMLYQNGVRGYRLHWKIVGNPDLVFVRKKICVFIHGCFWHRCPHCNLHTPKRNTDFWEQKFNRNVQRDKFARSALSKLGWNSIIVWECELKKKPDEIIKKIMGSIQHNKK